MSAVVLVGRRLRVSAAVVFGLGLLLFGGRLVAVAADATGPITAGGSAVTLTTSASGDNMRWTFSGTSGEKVSVKFTSVCCAGTAKLLNPDGSTVGGVGNQFTVTTSGGFIDTQTLNQTGTFTIFLDITGSATGSVTANLYDVPADATTSITPSSSGVSATLTTTVPGQNMAATFTGTAGQRIFVNFTSVCCTAWAYIVRTSNGSAVSNSFNSITTSGGIIDTVALPANDTYKVFVDPTGSAIGSVTFTTYLVADDLASPVAITGPSVPATLTIGQNGMLPFDAAQNQSVKLIWTGNTFSGNDFAIVNPNGSSNDLGLTTLSSGSASFTPSATGQHKLKIDPLGTRTGTVTVKLVITGDAPADGGQFAACGLDPVYRAEPVSGSNPTYQFQTSTSSGFGSTVDDSGSLPSTNTYVLPAGTLAPGTTYYWRWRTGTGSWSSVRSFSSTLPLRGSNSSWPMWSDGPLAVNDVNGNLVVSLPGPSFPTATGSMGASASYNSLDTTDRGLGAGWTLDYGAGQLGVPLKLLDHNLLTSTSRFDAVEAISPDGNSTCFTHVGQTNTYVAAPGDGTQLSKNADGKWIFLSGDTIATYGIASGSTGVANLESVEVTSGSTGNGKLSFTFDTTDPSKVTGVSDDTGRTVSFVWNSLDPTHCTGAIVCVTGPDSVTWKYVGDAGSGTSGHLSKVNDGTRDLAQVSYDGSGRVNKLQNANDLDPTNASPNYSSTHALTVSYDGSGHVSSVSSGPVTNQTPSSSTWSFDYHPGSVSTTATRAAHDGISSGTARTAAGYTLLTPPDQQGLGSPAQVKVFYDSHGNELERDDVFGNVTMAGYNSLDEPLWAEDEDGNPSDTTWDTVNDVPTSTTGPDPDGGGSLSRPTTTFRYDETQIGTSSTAGAALQGLRGAYYDNINLAGRPKLLETDSTVDYSWGSGGPTGLGATDNFSVRWTGNLNVTAAGGYTLSTTSDEGTRLVVDGIVAIDNWVDQTVTTVSSQTITLAAGLHKIELEYYDHTGSAEVHLKWACGGCSPAISTQVVPATNLQPAWENQTSVVSPLGRIAFSHYATPDIGLPDYELVQLGGSTNLITSYTYDSFGRVTERVMPKGNASRTIDSSGNLTGSPNTSYATGWTYYATSATASPPSPCASGSAVNQAAQLETKSVPGLTDQTFTYDSAGRVIAFANAAGTTCHDYDGEGRLTDEKAPGDSQSTTYTYDPAGNPRTATDATGTDTYAYDENDRLVDTVDSFGAEATYAYDADGNVTLREAYNGTVTSSNHYDTSYSYDAGDRLTGLTDPASRSYSFYYDSRSDLHAVQYPNGTFTWLDVNPAGWLTDRYNRHGTLTTPLTTVPSDSAPLSDYAYTYTNDGQIASEQRSGDSITTSTTSYGYDDLGRLTTVTGAPLTTPGTYCYDLDSNRTATYSSSTAGCTDPSPSATYSYSSTNLDQLTSVTAGSTTSYGYASDGQVDSRGSDSLTWDGWGRNTGGTYASTTLTYSYDPAGDLRQRTTTSPSSTTDYQLGGLFETNNSNTITTSYVTGDGIDLAHYAGPPTTSSTVTYQYYDGHGDTAAQADNSGARTNTYTYEPFGSANPSDPAPTNATTTRYTGQWDKQTDTTSDLVLMGARPYDLASGRFLAVDPIDGGSLNAYDYAGQDPINGYDLDGTCTTEESHGFGWFVHNLGHPIAEVQCLETAAVDDVEGGNGPIAQAVAAVVAARVAGVIAGRFGLTWRGGEITTKKTPRNWRISPFGHGHFDRLGGKNLFGRSNGSLPSRLPHYHRRGPGGIGAHRPWEGGP